MTDNLGNPDPRAPGEIGWHANAETPDEDFSLPAEGSGGAVASVPEPTPPTVNEDGGVDAGVTASQPEPEVVEEIIEPEVVEEVQAEASPEQLGQ